MKRQADVAVGQRYVGWGKTWRVARVWPQGVVEIVNIDDPANRMRLPLKQFKTREIGS
jgi:hypothetical protein